MGCREAGNHRWNLTGYVPVRCASLYCSILGRNHVGCIHSSCLGGSLHGVRTARCVRITKRETFAQSTPSALLSGKCPSLSPQIYPALEKPQSRLDNCHPATQIHQSTQHTTKSANCTLGSGKASPWCLRWSHWLAAHWV